MGQGGKSRARGEREKEIERVVQGGEKVGQEKREWG